MLQDPQGRALACALCAVLTVGMTACSGSSDDAGGKPAVATVPSTTVPAHSADNTIPRRIEVTFSASEVTGGARQENVKLGDRVEIRAVSDVVEELHVHTYEPRIALQPGKPGEIVFTASIPGRHEVEFEKSHKRALTLQVG